MDAPDSRLIPGGTCVLPAIGLLRAAGPDTASFLHGQLSNDVKLLGNEQARLAAFCTAQGRMLASFVYARKSTDELWLACSQDLIEPTLKRLRMFVMRARTQLDELGESHVALGLVGDAVARQLGPVVPDAVWGKADVAQGLLIRLPDAADTPRWLWLGPRDSLAQVQGSLPTLDPVVWDWLELCSAVVPVRAATSGQFVPQMLNYELVGGVDFKKGCYPGQEVVARSQYLGKLKRRAFLLQSATPAQAGQEIWWSGDERQPSGLVAAAAPIPAGQGEGWLLVAELKIAATEAGSLHLAAAEGPGLTLQPLPYALPHEAEAA